MTPTRTIGDRLDNYHARWGSQMSASKIPADDLSAKALYAKRQRWTAEAALDGCGWGKLTDWQTPEYLDAVEDRDVAATEHRSLILRMYRLRWYRDHTPTEQHSSMSMETA